MEEKNALEQATEEPVMSGGKHLKESEKRVSIGKALLFAAIGIVGALAVAFAAACVMASRSTTILHGVDVFGIDFGGQTVEQAAEQLSRDVVQGENAGARFCSDETHEVFRHYDELGMALDCTETARMLFAYGRGGNVLQNGWQYIFARGAEIKPVWSIDQARMDSAAQEISSELTFDPIDFSYTLDETGLYAVKPCNGQTFTAEAVTEACKTQLLPGRELSCVISTPSPARKPQNGNYSAYLSELQQQFNQPCRNASYSMETGAILPETMRASFRIAEAVEKMNAAAGGETVCITQDIELPKVTAEELEGVLFRDVLGTYTTKVGGAEGRHKNVKLTASRIDGFVMNSGESIRYGDLTTPFTLANGYYLAPMYVQGKTVDGAGGGACQASSTLYAAALLANLQIVQRTNHGFASDYIGLGLDATVASGGPELEIRNNTDYPIKVVATFYTQDKKDYITVKLLGTKVDNTYVKIRTDVLSTTPFAEEIIETSELAPGQRVVEQTAYTGYLVKTYRQIYDGSGTMLSEKLEATSKYNARNRIVKVGKAAEGALSETPVETPVAPPAEQPVEAPVETPTETPTETPVEPPVEAPAEIPEAPVEAPPEPASNDGLMVETEETV